jgi:hypothetical protein
MNTGQPNGGGHMVLIASSRPRAANGLEPKVSAALVRHTGERMQPVITAMNGQPRGNLHLECALKGLPYWGKPAVRIVLERTLKNDRGTLETNYVDK